MLDKSLDRFGFARNTLRLRQNGGARFGQAIAVLFAFDEANRKRRFQSRDASGDRRLIDAEFASGRERAASAGCGQEELQIAPVVHVGHSAIMQNGSARAWTYDSSRLVYPPPANEEGSMSEATPIEYAKRLPIKNLVCAVIAAMMAYVFWHNERFLIEPMNPVWQHYRDLGLFLLLHGVAGGSALILAPMQFFDRLRARFTKLHRVVGRIYVFGALILAPAGVYVQYLDYSLGVFPSRSFMTEVFIQASLLMITTGIGFVFALKRMIPQHRQWMTRSYAAALTFFAIRVILGVMGWDHDPVMVETVVWSCTASAILVADIVNQVYELQSMRRRPARAPLVTAVAAE